MSYPDRDHSKEFQYKVKKFIDRVCKVCRRELPDYTWKTKDGCIWCDKTKGKKR